MKQQTLSFYIKVITIILTISLLWMNPALLFEAVSLKESQSSLLDSEVDQLLQQSLPEDELAHRIAQSLNEHWSIERFNDLLVEAINHQRIDRELPLVTVNTFLREGSELYIQDLMDFHYLKALTPQGEDFRAYFSSIDDAPYRLSSYLFEGYIPLRDIRLSAWQEHPEVLAHFLSKQWDDHIQPEIMGQYMTLSAQGEWSEQHQEYYIRLVAILITDSSDVQ